MQVPAEIVKSPTAAMNFLTGWGISRRRQQQQQPPYG